MAKKIMKGEFITFEGSEGSGKSTHSKLLCNYLKKKGYRVVFLREPGGTAISEKIRRILLSPKNKSILPQTEMLLYMAARSQLVQEVILPALRQGKIVVCDRFLDSTLAYQGYGLGLDIAAIKYLGRKIIRLRPDLTIFMDLPAEKGLKRCGRQKDRIEQRSFDYHKLVRCGYLKLAREEPQRIKIIRVNNHKKKTQNMVRKIVECHLGI